MRGRGVKVAKRSIDRPWLVDTRQHAGHSQSRAAVRTVGARRRRAPDWRHVPFARATANESGRFTSGRVPDDPARNPAATIRIKTVRTSACRYMTDICQQVEPPLVDYGNGHLAACHHPLNVDKETLDRVKV